MAWVRRIALLDLGDVPVGPIFEQVRKCTRFEVAFETDIKQDKGINIEGPEKWHGHMTAAPITLEFNNKWGVSGGGQFDYDTFKVTQQPHKPGTGCWQGGKEWDKTGPFTVSDLHADFNVVENPDDGEYQVAEADVNDWKLQLLPLMTREFVFMADCGEGTGDGGFTNWLGLQFQLLHIDEDKPLTPLEISGWRPNGPASWKATFKRTVDLNGTPTTEDTTVVLTHKPNPNG
jgi:hypothetical protein